MTGNQTNNQLQPIITSEAHEEMSRSYSISLKPKGKIRNHILHLKTLSQFKNIKYFLDRDIIFRKNKHFFYSIFHCYQKNHSI